MKELALISIRINKDLLERIDLVMEKKSKSKSALLYRNLNRSDVIRAALELGITKLEKDINE